jgi:hypothetical protein
MSLEYQAKPFQGRQKTEAEEFVSNRLSSRPLNANTAQGCSKLAMKRLIQAGRSQGSLGLVLKSMDSLAPRL